MSQHPASRPLYIVICDSSSGGLLYERNVTDLDRATVIKDIADAQYDDVRQILEFNPVAETCRDVTREITREVCDTFDDMTEESPEWQQHIATLAGLRPKPARLSPAAFDRGVADFDRALAAVAEEMGA